MIEDSWSSEEEKKQAAASSGEGEGEQVGEVIEHQEGAADEAGENLAEQAGMVVEDLELGDEGTIHYEQYDDDPDAPVAAAAEGSAELQEQLAAALEESSKQQEQVLRVQAEYENMRRRMQRDVEKAHKFALEKFVQELLPVIDSLEMALTAVTGEDEFSLNHREGIELTLKMMGGVLEKFGIRSIDPTGEPFDPELHQAMTLQPSDEYDPNTVTQVMQKGYLLNDRLVRAAMVIVSKGTD